MKQIDKIILDLLRTDLVDGAVNIDDLIKDLEALKTELKEQHKKDVVKGIKYGINLEKEFHEEYHEESIEQYYNENK